MPAPSTTDVPDALFDAFPPPRREDWEAKVREDLRGLDAERVIVWESLEGVTQHAYYRADDAEALLHVDAAPITHAEQAPANSWRIRQDLTASDLDAAGRHAREALDGGATDLGVHVALEESNLGGVPVQRQDHLAALFSGIDLAETPIHFDAGTTALPLLAMLCNTAEAEGVPLDRLRGSVDYDPLAALAHHRLSDSDRAFDLAAGVLDFTSAHTPALRAATVDLRPYHDAGASAVQELACALGSLSEQLARLAKRDASLDDVAARLHWIVPVDTSYFVAIAKLRALRLLAPQVLAAYDVPAAPGDLFIQAVTSRRTETVYDPHVNTLRATTEAMSAVVGGCDVLAVRPYTAAHATPDDFALRLARNTQLILRHEAHLDDVADPAAGAYYIETLTNKLARAAWEAFQSLEAEGGLLAALASGTVQAQIADVRQKRQAEVAHRKHVLVGTNHYPELEETRDKDETAPGGTPLTSSDTPPSFGDEPGMEALRAAMRDGTSLGDALRSLQSPASGPAVDVLSRVRLAEPFERLRLRAERYAAAHGGPPRVVLVPVGDPSVRSVRAHFARNVFGVAGFGIEEPLGFDTPEAGAQAAAEAEADIVVLCSADETYPDLAPALCRALEAAGADPLVVVAGDVPERRDALEAAGVDAFIHRDSPLLETLEALQQRLGIG